MTGRVGLALAAHELLERTRDRWVIVISMLFALLASAVSLYGRNAGENAAALTGPSLVTLASLLVPLVALVLSHDAIVGERDRNTLGLLLSLPASRIEIVAGKFVGRALALVLAVVLGIGAAALGATGEQAYVLWSLLGPTLLLGLAFLSMGMLISSVVARPVTAASLVIVTWFGLVFFYDLALLGLLVVTDGDVSQDTIASLVVSNPVGLYRMILMERTTGPEVLESLGLVVQMPGTLVRIAIWSAWIAGPVALSGALLARRKALR
ncbi:MAG TPA: ABC transporter permease subunit [Kofleriaceae bacterium]|nr:ABC transporter permease subunit [Kofleriaceae bacterium]